MVSSIDHNSFSFIFIAAIVTPWSMAFDENENLPMTIFDTCINIIFLCDIVVQFFTAYYDGDYNIVDQRKVILYFKDLFS
jgi:hypothetical protein